MGTDRMAAALSVGTAVAGFSWIRQPLKSLVMIEVLVFRGIGI
jgi:hypothetical protein